MSIAGGLSGVGYLRYCDTPGCCSAYAGYHRAAVMGAVVGYPGLTISGPCSGCSQSWGPSGWEWAP